MVFCIIGLVIFGILGIFSAKYRTYAKEAWRCFTRQITLRPCDTQFDRKMKAKIVGRLMKISPSLSRFTFRYFSLLSWAMIIMMFVSVYWMGMGIYNTVQYGNCNGPGSHDFCIFNPFESAALHEKISKLKPLAVGDNPTIGSSSAAVKIVEVGCFRCPYTRQSESIRNQLVQKYNGDVSFTFWIMPLPTHNLSRETGEAALCAGDQRRYWEYHDKLFEYQDNMSIETMTDIAGELNLNTTQFDECFRSGKYTGKVQSNYEEGLRAGIFATPTYFVNGKPIVGIKNFADFEKIVVSEMKGTCDVI